MTFPCHLVGEFLRDLGLLPTAHQGKVSVSERPLTSLIIVQGFPEDCAHPARGSTCTLALKVVMDGRH